MAPLVFLDWMASLGDQALVEIDCLLPTGIIVNLQIERESTFAEIKKKLWEEAQAYPLYSELGDKNKYMFMCVTRTADRIELHDENRILDDVQPFQRFLKVVEKPPNKEEKILDAHITFVIGKGLHEFDAMPQEEINDFRRNMRKHCEKIAEDRDNKPWEDRVGYLFPTDVADAGILPKHIRERLPKNGLLSLSVINEWSDGQEAKYKFAIKCSTKPQEIIRMALPKVFGTESGQRVEDYVLKVSGREEYLVTELPLNQYMFIRKSLITDTDPCVVLKRKADVLEIGPPSRPPKGPRLKPERKPKPEMRSYRKSAPGKCLWDMGTDNFSFKIDTVSKFVFDKHLKYQIRCCIYHGPDTVCSVINTGPRSPNEGLISFDEEMPFQDLQLVNIPRMARLCFMFSAVADKNKKARPVTHAGGRRIKTGRQEMIPMGWVNIPLFDYKDNLRTGKHTLYMWDIIKDDMLSEEHLNPIGTVESNPTKSSMCLTLTFNSFNIVGPIYFPLFDKVLEVAAKNINLVTATGDLDISEIQDHFKTIMLDEDKNVHAKHFHMLEEILNQDALTPMVVQDKEKVWMLRYEIWSKYPSSLSKLLSSTDWSDHVVVAQMQALLQSWKELEAVEALELLDYSYADKNVRQFAIKCLENISNSQLQMYLLQLVQVLKYESYLECELVEFLLERALNNQHIGHNFFWLLRSEMTVEPSVAVRFGLILEAYCRGIVQYMRPLLREVEVMDKFYQLANFAKNGETGEMVKNRIREDKYKNAFDDVHSPLDPGLKISEIRVEKLKVMDSKMKPFWLEFENVDKSVNNSINVDKSDNNCIKFMYKRGDDLRQDMLTLQILRIIDTLWQANGMDLRLTPYGCLSTGEKEGLIEIVTPAETITKIQKNYSSGLSAFNRTALFRWLKAKNPSDKSMDKAMNEFMYSLAGYSVATYVLGIGDRHGDNIMLKHNGQLCHIDFGHIMGNFKKAFRGMISREPAPFQLTPDFVYLLMKGEKKDTANFEKFKELCEKAYMVLRNDRKRLITLFLMMVNTGIPELPSVAAIAKHLPYTLVPDKTDEKARQHFRERLETSLKKANWVQIHAQFHNIMH